MKKAWIPCGITLANLASGVISIIFTHEKNFRAAFIMIVLAIVFDLFDGKVARMLKATSDIGTELDSLADLVSFGIAPALVLYMTITSLYKGFNLIEFVAPVFFALCGAYRLARYNAINSKDYFVGLPIPVAGATLISFCLLYKDLFIAPIIVVSFILSLLMISTARISRNFVEYDYTNSKG